MKIDATPAATFVGLELPSVETRFSSQSHAVRLRSILNSPIAMNPKRTRGFTLIELVTAVAIVGILAAIALPSYSKYQIRSNRAAAESLMLDLANREQQYLLDQRAYKCGATPVSDLMAGVALPDKVVANYTVDIPAGTCSATAFIITATPKAGSIQVGDGTLTLNQDGAKSSNWQ